MSTHATRLVDERTNSRWRRASGVALATLFALTGLVFSGGTPSSSLAKTGDVGNGNNCFQGVGTQDLSGHHCTAGTAVGSNYFITDYDGDITLEFPYRGKDEYVTGSFIFDADLYVDDTLVLTKYCNGSCSGKLTRVFSSQSGTTYYDLDLDAYVTGKKNCHDGSEDMTITVVRPSCPSQTSVQYISNKNQWTTSVTIQGTVSDNGCTSAVNGNSAVHVSVSGPNDAANSGWINVSNGQFSWTYTLPFPKLPWDYGNYTVTVNFDGSKNTDHPLKDSSDTETFKLGFYIALPDLTAGGTTLILPGIADPNFAVVLPENNTVFVYGTSEESATQIDVDWAFRSGSMQGLAVVPDFFGPGSDPFLAFSSDGDSELRFFDLDGQFAGSYPSGTGAPWGLAFDGNDALWVADALTGTLRELELETGAFRREIHTGLPQLSDLSWDATTNTLLVLSGGGNLARIDPVAGTVVDLQPLRSSDHQTLIAYEGGAWVAETSLQELYLVGEPAGVPGSPEQLSAWSDESTPSTILLTWLDPDGEPGWDQIHVYRNGGFLTSVVPGTESYSDEGLTLYDHHEYFLRAYRSDDGMESEPTPVIESWVGRRPPVTVRVPDDRATIQQALMEAMDGDVIEVAPGTYSEPIRFAGRIVSVVSLEGPSVTVLDASSHPFSFVVFDSTETREAVLSGFTIEGAELQNEALIHCGSSASPTIENNVILGNVFHHAGAAIGVEAGTGAPLIRTNTIVHNQFFGDQLGTFAGGPVRVEGGSPVLERNIIAFNDNAYGLHVEGGTPSTDCNDVWANELGGFHGAAPSGTDLSVDPLFCDPEAGDLRLCANSPLLAAGDCGRVGALGQGCASCGDSVDYLDHDAGNIGLTVTDQGILGFLDSTQAEGSGLVYPAGGSNQLFIGSLWVGQSPTYVANRDYDADPAREWTVSADPDGHVWIYPDGNSDQDIHAIFDDSGATVPLGLRVHQESWAFSDPAEADLIVLRYLIENTGATELTDLYCGLFFDLDLGVGTDDTGVVDPIRDLVYLGDTAGPFVGLRVLSGVRWSDGGSEHEPIRNLTLVHNPSYVWPEQYVPDADKYAFLSAADPDHVLTDGTAPDDYSVLGSVGPFTIEPGGLREVAFAVVAGESESGLLDAAEAAQFTYLYPVGVPETATLSGLRLLPNQPNPFADQTTVRFYLPNAAAVDLGVFDVSGRRVRTLWTSAVGSGPQTVLWDGRDAMGRRSNSGVYFLRLVVDGKVLRRTMHLIR